MSLRHYINVKILGQTLCEAVLDLYRVLGLSTLCPLEAFYVVSDFLRGELPILCKDIARYTAFIIHIHDVLLPL